MILYRYFAKEVFVTMLAVASIVLIISMGWRFSGYLNQAASGSLTKDVLFMIMAFRLPGFLELIVPISYFLAIMLAYGRLYVDSEMVILESCGLSPARLIRMTLNLSLVVMVLTAAISLWLKPAGEEKVEAMFADQRRLTELDMMGPGRFQTLRSGKRVTYAEEIDDDSNFKEVFVNEYGDFKAGGVKDVVTLQAARGATKVDASGTRFLVLKDGTRYSGKPGTRNYQVIEYEEYGQFIRKEQTVFRSRRRSAIATRDLIADQTPRNLSELHWRIAVIVMIPVIAIMAIPLSKVNPRQGRFTRLVPGMILCFLYIVLLSAARSGMEKGQVPISLALWWVHGIYIVLILCLYNLQWFRRTPKRVNGV